MGLNTPETCRGWRNIQRISCASSWFFFTELCRTNSIKYKEIMVHCVLLYNWWVHFSYTKKVVMLRSIDLQWNCITEAIQVTESRKYFPRGSHAVRRLRVGQPVFRASSLQLFDTCLEAEFQRKLRHSSTRLEITESQYNVLYPRFGYLR